MIMNDAIDPAFKQWKEDHPSTYEILFSLLLRWADICKDIHGYDEIAHMWRHHTNSTKRWSRAHPHVARHVTQYRIEKIYLNSMARTFAIEVELDFINGMGEVVRSHYISEIVKEDIACDIEDEVMKYLTGKSEEDKPTYKKPGVTYQHVSTAKPGSTETQKVIERMLKNSFYGTQAISLFDGKAHFDADTPWTTINPDLNYKFMEYAENDVKCCMEYYKYLNEKETKEMKKLIINHNAVIVLCGTDEYGKAIKTVVKILDPDTKEEREPWNTKLAVVSAIAKSFEHTRDGKHSTCYKLYEMLNTIKKPTNATIDFVADEMFQNGKRLKNFKWYQEAIKVKRPAPGKSVVIKMEDK